MNGDNLSPEVVLTADVSDYQRNLRVAEQQTNTLLDSVTKLSDGIGRMHRAASQNIQLVGAGVTAGVVGATVAAGRFQSQMEGLEASTVMTNRSLDVTRNRVNNLRGELGVTTNEAVGLVTQLNKMGQGGRPVGELSKEFVKLSAVTGESLPALTSSMVTLQRQMGTEGLQNTRNYSASLASLSEQAGVSAQGILDFSNAIAPVSDMAGMSQKQVLGFSTAFNKAGQDGFAAANMYSRMVMDITRSIQQGGPQLQGYANLLGVSVEQMKNIPVAESVTRIFEAISSEGPRAVSILEQLGFEGVRSYRSAVAVAQRGGIRQAQQQAAQPADVEKFAEAADKALGGMNDQMQIFQNNLARTGQAIGATFLPAAEKMLGVLTLMAQGVATATENLGNIPGIGIAATGAGLLAGGALLRALPLMALGGAGAMVARSSMGAGWQTAGPNGANAPAWARTQAAQVAAGDPRVGPTQRWMFNAGAGARAWVGDHITREDGTPRSMARAMWARTSSGLGSGIHLAGYLTRSALKPLEPGNLSSISNRDQIRGGPEWSRRLQSSGQEAFQRNAAIREQGVSNYQAYRQQGFGRFDSLDRAARDVSELGKSSRDAAQETRRYSSMTRAARTEMMRLGGSTVRAAGGAAMWGAGAIGSAGASVAGQAMGLGRALGSSALGLVGGGVGATILGGAGLYMASNVGQRRVEEIQQSTEDFSRAGEYEAALSLAGSATMTFADAVNQARDEILGASSDNARYGTGSLTAEDARTVTSPAFQYTNEAVASMTPEEVQRMLTVGLPGLDNEGRGAMIADALKRLRDPEVVNRMLLEQAPDIKGEYASVGDDDKWWAKALGIVGFVGESTKQGANRAASSTNRLLGMSPDEYREPSLFATSNQALEGIWENYQGGTPGGFGRGFNRGERNASLAAYAQQMGAQDPESLDELKKFFNQVNLSNQKWHTGINLSGEEAADQLTNMFLEQGESELANILREARDMGADVTLRDTSALTRQIEERPYQNWGLEGHVRSLQDTQLGGALLPDPRRDLRGPYATTPFGINPPPMSQESVQNLAWRDGSPQARSISDAIDFALGDGRDNVGAQESAAWKLASDGAEALGTNSRDTARAMHELRDAINDARDPLHQILSTSLQMRRGEEDYALRSQPHAERIRVVRERREDSEARLNSDNPGDDAFPMWWADRQAEMEEIEGVRQRLTGIVRGGREMDISIAQADEDYTREKGWSDEDFNRNRSFQRQDFNRARRLQDEARDRSVSRAWRDYNTSRERGEYEFNLGRERQEENYQRQLARSWRDFGISRERGQYEFFLGRERQEEAYARQLERSWRDFNITRERGQYEFDLQRERGEFDFNLQRQRGEEDFYRQRHRNQADFDLSRRRQEEDFNHQLVLLAEQSARSIYNIYERVQVQRTLSGTNLLRNMEDQARRMEEQQANLMRAREMGLSDEAIRMLGLNEAANAQQLARLMRELTPEMIAQLNQGVGDRTDLAGDLFMDPANQQYAEMVRQFQLQRDRAAEDFQKAMDRSAEDFQRGMARMREDYHRALERSATDFERMRSQQREDFLRSISDQRVEMDIQMAQSMEDFERMRKQQQEDFSRSITDQREDMDIQLAQSMTDFNRSRNQQHADFMKSLADMQEDYSIQVENQEFEFNQSRQRQLDDYNRHADRAVSRMETQQNRMRDSFNRSHEEIFSGIADLSEEALSHLEGATEEQISSMIRALGTTETQFGSAMSRLADKVKDILDSFGINNVWIASANQGGADPTKNSALAEGGPVPGQSPHPKADNIPIWATAGEFMQPVQTVQHYGVDIMEKMRKREVPKEAFAGYAEGGLIAGLWGRRQMKPVLESYGRDLQDRGFQVGEHPKFGGVHPTAHLPTSKGGLHYIGHAIDVNYDGYGQAMENRRIDGLIREIESRGLGYIWRSAGHYGHIHIDTSPYRQLNGRLLSTGQIGGGMDSIKKDRDTGLYFLDDVYKEILESSESDRMEKLFDLHPATKSRYKNKSIQKMIAVRAYDEMMGDYAPEGNEPFNVPGGVERWRSTVLRALGMVGQAPSLAEITLRRMNQESSGDPRAINLWDSNAKRGTPSKGLMQVIDPTFRAHAMPGYEKDIWDPLSNILASMRYALNRYGGLHTAYARAGGYAEGGEIDASNIPWHGEGGIFTQPSRIGVAERGPEMVLPLYGRGVEFLTEIINRSRPDYRETFVRRDGVPEVSKQIVYNSSYDHSTHYHGEITVQSQDPEEMQRKLAAKKRQDALIGRR